MAFKKEREREKGQESNHTLQKASQRDLLSLSTPPLCLSHPQAPLTVLQAFHLWTFLENPHENNRKMIKHANFWFQSPIEDPEFSVMSSSVVTMITLLIGQCGRHLIKKTQSPGPIKALLCPLVLVNPKEHWGERPNSPRGGIVHN